MSSTYSSSLRIELIGSGDQAGAWGATTDSNLAYVLDTAIAGYQTVSVASANQALTHINGPTSTSALNQAVYAMLRLTTSTGANFAIYAPPASKTYIIYNDSGYTATIYNSTVIGNTTAAGTGISVANGLAVLLWSDGTNFYNVDYNSAKTGTGSVVFSNSPTITSPTLVTPALGTPTSGNFSTGTFTWPTFNQNTTGTANNVVGTVAIANGGTGQTTAATAGAALGAVGVGQTWTDVTSSRALGTTYTNSTGRPIMIAVTITIPSQLNSYVTFSINGSIVGYFGANSAAQPALLDTTTLIIPDGATYRVATVTGSPSIQIWWELR